MNFVNKSKHFVRDGTRDKFYSRRCKRYVYRKSIVSEAYDKNPVISCSRAEPSSGRADGARKRSKNHRGQRKFWKRNDENDAVRISNSDADSDGRDKELRVFGRS